MLRHKLIILMAISLLISACAMKEVPLLKNAIVENSDTSIIFENLHDTVFIKEIHYAGEWESEYIVIEIVSQHELIDQLELKLESSNGTIRKEIVRIDTWLLYSFPPEISTYIFFVKPGTDGFNMLNGISDRYLHHIGPGFLDKNDEKSSVTLSLNGNVVQKYFISEFK